MFGAGRTVPETSSSTAVPDVKTTPMPVVTQSVDKEGLFASWVRSYRIKKVNNFYLYTVMFKAVFI